MAADDAQAVLAAAMSEKEFQGNVVAMARIYGWLTYHTWDSHRSDFGFPDLVLAKKGTVLLVELKSQTGRLTPEQKKWQQHAAVLLWRPGDLLDGSIESELRFP